jgi:hypothetical protein
MLFFDGGSCYFGLRCSTETKIGKNFVSPKSRIHQVLSVPSRDDIE